MNIIEILTKLKLYIDSKSLTLEQIAELVRLFTTDEMQTLILTLNLNLFIPVDELPNPASSETMNKIYLVPISGSENGKDEYITIDNGESTNPRYEWFKIGSTEFNLDGYLKTGDLTSINNTLNLITSKLQELENSQSGNTDVPSTVSRTASEINFKNSAETILTNLKLASATNDLAGILTAEDYKKILKHELVIPNNASSTNLLVDNSDLETKLQALKDELTTLIGSILTQDGEINLADYYKKSETYNRTEIDAKIPKVITSTEFATEPISDGNESQTIEFKNSSNATVITLHETTSSNPGLFSSANLEKLNNTETIVNEHIGLIGALTTRVSLAESAIATNTNNITTNTSKIAENSSDIQTNAGNIDRVSSLIQMDDFYDEENNRKKLSSGSGENNRLVGLDELEVELRKISKGTGVSLEYVDQKVISNLEINDNGAVLSNAVSEGKTLLTIPFASLFSDGLLSKEDYCNKLPIVLTNDSNSILDENGEYIIEVSRWSNNITYYIRNIEKIDTIVFKPDIPTYNLYYLVLPAPDPNVTKGITIKSDDSCGYKLEIVCIIESGWELNLLRAGTSSPVNVFSLGNNRKVKLRAGKLNNLNVWHFNFYDQDNISNLLCGLRFIETETTLSYTDPGIIVLSDGNSSFNVSLPDPNPTYAGKIFMIFDKTSDNKHYIKGTISEGYNGNNQNITDEIDCEGDSYIFVNDGERWLSMISSH